MSKEYKRFLFCPIKCTIGAPYPESGENVNKKPYGLSLDNGGE